VKIKPPALASNQDVVSYRHYNEATETDLAMIGKYRQTNREVRLRADAARAWQVMIGEASAAGMPLVPISGFRTLAYQESLFKKAVIKYGSEEAAVRWVARPGHSEHHTGLALDIGDEESPAGDVELQFEQTGAFQWLREHASQFGFELSFPHDNSRGVNYEPWHWRFIGNPEARDLL
jgi:D-alanyl-D-alanine carboxypeptidase